MTDRPYRYAALRGQFIASARPLATLPADWRLDALGGWHLYRHPTTRMVPLLIGEEPVGWMTGEPWEGDRLVREPLSAATEAALLDRIDALGGPLAAVAPGRFARHDAMGQQSLVYSAEHRAVATNPLLIWAACGGEVDDELVTLMDIPARNRWYPFGLTPVVGVRRLLPNHRLDLTSWEAGRYWPRPEDWEGAATIEEAADALRQRVREGIGALASVHSLQIGLTGGYDSRLMLACARKHAGRLVAATNAIKEQTLVADREGARRVARVAEVPHEWWPARPATAEEQADFVDQTGLSAAGPRYEHIGAMNALGSERVLLWGHAGESLRAFYYGRLRRHGGGLHAVRAAAPTLAALRTPEAASLVAAHARWVRELPAGVPDEAVASLLYLEQRLGCWAAVLAQSGVYRPVWPISHRDIARLALRLPEQDQSEAVFHRAILAEWPELLAAPFNSVPRPLWRRALGRLRRALRRALRPR